jgi:triacylglycerol esterase/lipase EstA (alpha/beta hydrolase family)
MAVALVAALAAPVGASSPAAARPDPVLLVHGFRGSSSGWHALETTLEAHGYRSSEIDAIDYGDDASNVDVARQIGRAADALRLRTGASRVDIVSHSMGAISSRYWLERLGGAAHVDAWVSLAGVNEGTVWAYGCYVLTPCREMVPTSSVLEGLNRDFRASGPIRFGAWWSPCDDAIVPRANAELPGAHNVETACLGHSELRTDPHVLGQVVRFLGRGLRPRTA